LERLQGREACVLNTVVCGFWSRFTLVGVFALLLIQFSQAQTESVIHSFQGAPSDGSAPYSGLLLDQHGNLYGTTSIGGSYYLTTRKGGVVYELSPTGPLYREKVLYNFGGGLDGYEPLSGLVSDSLGDLYGTTEYGGLAGCGTFYEVTPGISWTETGLFFFPCHALGQWPYNLGKLAVDSNGNFYGTTYGGGDNQQGMVFQMSVALNGITETPLYSFDRSQDYPDGETPHASVILDAQGNVYGVTPQGGTAGWGAAFGLAPRIRIP
jgi:uncharacterized repeat protein (TIGR03803 family)